MSDIKDLQNKFQKWFKNLIPHERANYQLNPLLYNTLERGWIDGYIEGQKGSVNRYHLENATVQIEDKKIKGSVTLKTKPESHLDIPMDYPTKSDQKL